MRPVLSACSRLSSFALRSQPYRVSLHRASPRRHIHFDKDTPSSVVATFLEKSFHGPDEDIPLFDLFHHPFVPGDVFQFGDDEFRIERKLRHRLLSRVWLATHTNKHNPVRRDRRFVALETFDDMFSSRLSVEPEKNDHLHHVRYIKVRQNEGAPGSEYCDRALHVFLGPHLCVVKEPCGPSLARMQEELLHRSFTLPVAKRIIRQTLLALDFLHTTMQRTHLGVNVYNIQAALLGPQSILAANIQSDLEAYPPDIVYRSFWDRFRSRRPEGGATKLELPQPLPIFGLSPSLENLEIRLGRCEYALSDKQLEKLAAESEADEVEASTPWGYAEFHAPLRLASPEAIRGSPHPYSPPINIWAIGHLVSVRLSPPASSRSQCQCQYY